MNAFFDTIKNFFVAVTTTVNLVLPQINTPAVVKPIIESPPPQTLSEVFFITGQYDYLGQKVSYTIALPRTVSSDFGGNIGGLCHGDLHGHAKVFSAQPEAQNPLLHDRFETVLGTARVDCGIGPLSKHFDIDFTGTVSPKQGVAQVAWSGGKQGGDFTLNFDPQK